MIIFINDNGASYIFFIFNKIIIKKIKMNNFIGKIFKKLTNNENENKAKEEEDLPEQNNFTFDIEINRDETLDKLVSDIIIRGEKVQK